MKCPVDNTSLVITERQGVEIDYCPTCRGVWLDRGELDKLIDRSQDYSQSRSERSSRSEQRYEENSRHRHDDDEYYEKQGGSDYHKRRKKESFLGDLFDF